MPRTSSSRHRRRRLLTAALAALTVLVGLGSLATGPADAATTDCGQAPVTPVGGTASGVRFTSSPETRCLHITAAPTDRLLVHPRATGVDGAFVSMSVKDASGTNFCQTPYGSCNAVGGTDYTVTIYSFNVTDVPLDVRVDVWRVGSDAGWDPTCTSHPLSVEGFGPLSGALSESSTGWCGVIDLPYGAGVRVAVASPTGTAQPRVAFFSDRPSWPSARPFCTGFFGIGDVPLECHTVDTGLAGARALVLVLAEAPTPVTYQVQGLCEDVCSAPSLKATPADVAPASSPAGTLIPFTLRGSHLTLATTISLSQNGSRVAALFRPRLVSADGTTLTGRLTLGTLTPGRYDVVTDGYDPGNGSDRPGTTLPGSFTVSAASPVPGLLTTVAPTRMLDTRSGLGAPRARVASGHSIVLQVAGAKGLPASGVAGVALNVTAVSPGAAGYVTAYPDGGARPGVSTLNFAAGQTIANLAVVPLTNGRVVLYNGSAKPVDLLADVTAYVSARGTGLTTTDPTRVLDTRSGTGAPRARVAPNGTVRLKVAGTGDVPATGVTAVAMTVTAVDPTSSGYLTAFPDGTSRPTVSTLNFLPHRTVPNLALVPVTNGYVDLYNGSPGTVDLVADVSGYATASGAPVRTVAPVRVLDTRTGLGGAGSAIAPLSAAVLPLDPMTVPYGSQATAALLNVTVTNATAAGYLTVSPEGRPLPLASNLNFGKGQTVAGLVLVPVAGNQFSIGAFDLRNGSPGSVDVVADLVGFVVPPPPTGPDPVAGGS